MQPTFLPWSGYFNLIAAADAFVFLDDAQFVRASWHNRNRVLVNGSVTWLSAAVRHEGARRTIAQATVDDDDPWRARVRASIEGAYGGRGRLAELEQPLARIADASLTSLADLNIAFIAGVMALLGITTPTFRASTLGIDARRSDRLLQLCRYFGAEVYLSPVGSWEYLHADGFIDAADPIRLALQSFVPVPYPQGTGRAPFESHLSIVDAIAELGVAQAAAYVTARYAAGTALSQPQGG